VPGQTTADLTDFIDVTIATGKWQRTQKFEARGLMSEKTTTCTKPPHAIFASPAVRVATSQFTGTTYRTRFENSTGGSLAFLTGSPIASGRRETGTISGVPARKSCVLIEPQVVVFSDMTCTGVEVCVASVGERIRRLQSKQLDMPRAGQARALRCRTA
jgi:hypothetical protein